MKTFVFILFGKCFFVPIGHHVELTPNNWFNQWFSVSTFVFVCFGHKLKCPKQIAVVWDDAETGVRLKGLIDAVIEWQGWTYIVDVKSVGDSAEATNFGRRGDNLHYPMQAHTYLTGLNAIAPFPRRWLWVVVERFEPFQVATYYADCEEGPEFVKS